MLLKSLRLRTIGAGGLRTDLALGSIGSFGLKVFYTLLALATSIVLARALTPSGYGIYTFAFSLMSLLAIPVQLGLPTLLVREVSRYCSESRWDLLRGLLRRANQTVLLLSSVMGLVAFFAAWQFASHIDEVQLLTILWALPLLPILAFNQLRQATLQGLGRVVVGQLPDMIVLPILLLTLLSAALLIGDPTPPQAMMLYCIASAITLAVGSILLLRKLPHQARVTQAKYDTRNWARSILPLSLIGGMSAITSQTDIFMLGVLATPEEVGLYRVAMAGGGLVAFTLTAVNAVLAPHVARLYKTGDHVRLQRILTRSAQVILASALPIAGVLIVFGGDILAMVYGDAFRPSYGALVVLCLGQIVNAGMGSVALILNMTGHERETLKGIAVSAALNVLLNLLLIPIYGAFGAALATAGTLATVNLILSWQVWKHTSLQSAAIFISVAKEPPQEATENA